MHAQTDHHPHDDFGGLRVDLGRIVSRRSMLRVMTIAGLSGVAVACGSGSGSSSTTAVGSTLAPGSSAASTTAGSSTSAAATTAAAAGATCVDVIPEETAGPYPGNGTNGPNALAESGIVRRDIRSSFGASTTTVEGVPLTIELAVVDSADGCTPVEGAAIYLWHCTPDGAYSMYSAGVEDENFLRGVQVSDAAGIVTFTSVFPGCYSGRWPHAHFEVYADEAAAIDGSALIATSQLAFEEVVCRTVYAEPGYETSTANLAGVSLTGDNVFGDDGAVNQLGTFSGDPASGITARLVVGVDPSSVRARGTGGAGAGAPPGPPPGGGQGGQPPGATTTTAA